MALEIKVLDYGDVEQLESSFLVLGRDCGRTRKRSAYAACRATKP
jgi:hypothetical protein